MSKPDKKIHIEALFEAFQKFQSASRHATSLVRKPVEWQKSMDEAREVFKKEIGPLADHIDWTQRD